jgi:hypothetical protein
MACIYPLLEERPKCCLEQELIKYWLDGRLMFVGDQVVATEDMDDN